MARILRWYAVSAAVPDIFEAHLGIGENKFMSYLAASFSIPGSCKILTGTQQLSSRI